MKHRLPAMMKYHNAVTHLLQLPRQHVDYALLFGLVCVNELFLFAQTPRAGRRKTSNRRRVRHVDRKRPRTRLNVPPSFVAVSALICTSLGFTSETSVTRQGPIRSIPILNPLSIVKARITTKIYTGYWVPHSISSKRIQVNH